MPRFKAGDRVQLTGDIARFYRCVIGIVTAIGTDPSSVLIHYQVRLADDTVATFFDFQLQTVPVVQANVVSDSLASLTATGSEAASEDREIRWIGSGVEIHAKISGQLKTIVGQVSKGKSPIAGALVTVVIDRQPVATKATDTRGEAEFENVPAGEVTLETFVPGRRIAASLKT
jgi:hypothetical protein